MKDKEYWHLGLTVPALVLFLIGACAVFSAAAFIIVSRIDNAAVQPQVRQNENQNADYRRSVEAQFRAAYALYQNEVQAVTLDQEALSSFVVVNGPPSGYPPYSSAAQEYEQLFQSWTQDRQALVNAVTAYNALCTNADTGPYRPADLPASIDVPTPGVEATATP